MNGDRQLAEKDLRLAAETDHRYLPAWALANFYFRAGDLPQFWDWSRRAAGMSYQPTALFQLWWRVSNDAEEILARGVPRVPSLRRAYLDFLLQTDRLEAASELAREIARTADSSDIEALLRYCDVALARRQGVRAREIWSALVEAHLIPNGRDSILTNGDFAHATLGRGFDWRLAEVSGASVLFSAGTGTLLVSLSGNQPEICNLLAQHFFLPEKGRYRFHFRYRAHRLPSNTGLSWSLVDSAGGNEFANAEIRDSGSSWTEQSLYFLAAEGHRLGEISLRYRRPPGSIRAEGAIEIMDVAIEAAP